MKIGNTWEQRKLSDITDKIGSGKTPKGGSKTYSNEGTLFLRSQNINNDVVSLKDTVFISPLIDTDMHSSRVYQNDVLLNITGASIGRSAVYKGLKHANVNQHVCIIRPDNPQIANFLQMQLTSNIGQKQIEQNQAGGGREGLNFKQIGNMQFNFPKLQEIILIESLILNISNTIVHHQQNQKNMDKLSSMSYKVYFILNWLSVS